ncbi:MAG: flagellar export protein FliJ [Pseudomonadota bacterium]
MAIKSLKTLIRLQKHKIDNLRRELSPLLEELRQLEFAKEKLQQELIKEIETINNNPEFGGFFGAYSANVKERIEKISSEIIRVNSEIEKKRSELSEEFSEQKKYELALESEKKRILENEKRLENLELDEIAMRQYNNLNLG